MDAYPLIRAARFYGVAPWELAEQPCYWRDLALTIENAENAAQNEIAKRAAAINK